MTSSPVTYALDGSVASIVMDDGKVNVLSPAMLGALDDAFDRAEADGAVVVLEGRVGIFSAGFDLKVLRGGGREAVGMLQSGFRLAERMLSFPTPVVIACTGHAVAMGVFLLLSGDYRVGATGPFRITANEVAIGLTMPRAAVEICRQRLTPAAFNRAVLLAEPFSPEDAAAAGFLDRAAPPDDVVKTAREVAVQLAGLDLAAHAASKLRARAPALTALRAGIEADDVELEGMA
ncbi:MAG TPA: crotonase/enoyl-CoA hydratase family protein [Acidimicrobiales bacterium]|nr:crotonase/enoyl-CoA hydratase family protein [Acidimicrobiales bacterium]